MSEIGPPPPPSDPNGPYGPQPGAGQPYPGDPQPQYPTYPQPGYGPPAPAPRPSPFTGLAAKFGDRAIRRPEPRFTVSIAAAGMALVLVGTLIWMGSFVGHGISSNVDNLDDLSTSRNYVGALLFAIVTAAGYFLVVSRRQGPMATAGVVAGALGFPLTLGFLTFDLTDVSSGFPFNFDLVYWGSMIVWAASYLFVPGARGRSFFLYLAADYLYFYVLFKAAENEVGLTISSSIDNPTSSPHVHGAGTVAAVSLVFGLGYYAIAALLDRRAKHGAATGLVYPAFGATAIGILALAPDLHQTGVGVVLILLSCLLCWYGGQFGRRFTCWAWAGGFVVGVGLIVGDALSDNATGLGITLLIIGVAVVAAAHFAAATLHEPIDLDPEAIVRSR